MLTLVQLDPVRLSWMVAALVAVSVFLLVIGLRARRFGTVTLDDRVKRYAQVRTVEEIELSEPFFDRAIKPVLQSILRIFGRFAPQRNIEELERNLAQAGRPLGLTAIDFLGARLLAAVLLALLVGGMAFVSKSPARTVLVSTLVGGLMGFYFPIVWLRWRMAGRRRSIERALPDCLDMLVVCIDAGLGFDSALLKVAERWRHELARELDQVVYEMRMGRPRMEALQELVTRTGVEDVASFVAVVLQADQLGVSIAKALRIHAEQMRVLRRYRAEELARQAVIKMLFPLVFLIFPALLAVILGPALPQLLKTLGTVGG